MKIETKFNVGQKVFFMQGSKLVEAEINSINIEARKEAVIERYYFRFEYPDLRFEIVDSSMVFRSREEFLNQLI